MIRAAAPVGVPGTDLFSEGYQKVSVPMPHNLKDTRLIDLDRDGRPDILLNHRTTDGYWKKTDPDEPDQIVMLLSR